MPPKRVRKTVSTTHKPPSPPLSEKNASVADENADVEPPEAQDKGSMGSPRSPRHDEGNEPPVMMDEDEEMPEESGNTIQHARPEYAVGAGGYNMLKSYKGQVYSGMAVGGSHTWNYDQGVWKETKEEPDLWRIDYQTNKRRARKAPEGSGAPVGTEYHWLIVAHQFVKKTDANTYETNLTGSKYKLAYKSASSNSWSVPTVKKQRDREVELLEDAKQRVQGLPPVLASEKVKVEKSEKGQQKLDSMFTKAASGVSKKRKLAEDSGG
ncbi:hypothetical protein F9C07_8049 [Aspergillus flavus]|uniref:Uncharacterized protein n=4 Tax=Aspergillus subgen. Circumdati TaxID=2720871 RepID=B8NIC9_ASPFN|nr:uncharacterized protein G4B84_010060 [Aspergillus flavus NRRL3357]KAJ1706826.1 hypothetical protein NYO67_11022 [Aspergillus flavus]KOC15924.1 hypothetical protein AFLA70_132g002270 [Aspergillus flavus AF70]OOO09372.1 hypothetical protein OAory_01106680 [Aspergillus oryzae]GMG46115.1 unnamed protein product [Aspergillus oryzae var. brunneus]KAF7622010.1 hypothetical protein AFLA_008559 [Aspergillus flavus NRRL3357]